MNAPLSQHYQQGPGLHFHRRRLALRDLALALDLDDVSPAANIEASHHARFSVHLGLGTEAAKLHLSADGKP